MGCCKIDAYFFHLLIADVHCHALFSIFTVLHGMHTRSSDENSVCQMRDL